MAQAFDSPTTLLVLVLPLLLIIFILTKFHKTHNPKLPPGPTPWPVLGNLHQHSQMTPITLANLAQSYGPLMLLKLGTQSVVVGSSPSAAMDILKTNDRILSARSVPHSVPLTSSQIENTSFWADPLSDHWRNVRAICRTELFSSKSLERQANTRERKVMEMVEFWGLNEGRGVNVEHVVYVTVLNMFGNVLFSKDVVDLGDESKSDEVKGYLRGIIETLSAPNLSDFYPFLGVFDFQGLRKKHREMSMKMCKLLREILEERRNVEMDGLRDEDFLDILIYKGFTDDQINKLIEELFQAGIDTTTSTINRTITLLLINPKSMTNLKQELANKLDHHFVKERPDLENLPYLQACIKETLRLHPPAPLLLSHRALETCQVMNYTIPKNARVLVNVWAISRDTTVWIDPSEYRPERFLESNVDFKGNDFEFLPFGAGRRVCPGLSMAAKIVPLVVASMIYFYDWSVPDGTENKTSEMVQPLVLIPHSYKMSSP